jgi:hypothetical protein
MGNKKGPKSFHLPMCIVMDMGGQWKARFRSVAVVCLFLLSTTLQAYTPAESPVFSDDASTNHAVTIGQAESVTVGSFPDGASTKISLEIPDGEAIQGLDVELEPARLPSSMAHSWSDTSEFKSGSTYDGMDVNGTSLTILPQGWEWDFESANHGWTLGSPAWLRGYDTSIGATSGVSSGSNAIYTYNGNYPNSMSTTIWATSPVMDCSSCSGAWELSFMKRLGVESASFDHAYVAVKTTSGSWTTVYSSGYTADTSFNAQTISINNYVANNPAFQVRFGIGTTDGSVTYTGWNVDDVSVLPTSSGVSSGEGNWTSEAFGPSLFGQGENKAFGYMLIDATVPSGSVFEWRLLDAVTNQPVDGFEHMTALSIDLGMVDWVAHPLVRLDTHMESSSGGTPSVHGFHFDGVLNYEFDQDPTAYGWQLQGATWSQGKLSGSGVALSPSFNVRSGFGGFLSNSILNANGVVQASIDDGATWIDLQQGTYHWLTAPAYTVQLRIDSTGGAWELQTLDVELVRTSVVDGFRFDVALDGVSDWSMLLPEIGRLGIQDGFLNGEHWQSRSSISNAPAMFDFALPLSGVDAFEFAFASPSVQMANPSVKFSIAGQELLSKSMASVQDLTLVTLSDAELNTLNAALSQAVETHGVNGLPMSSVQLSIGSSTSSTTVVAGGIFAPYDGALSMEFDASDSLVIALNSQLQSTTAIAGVKTIDLPIRMASTGAVHVTIEQLDTQASIEPISIQVSNVSDTFVPSTEWIEVSSTFDFTPLGVSDAASYVQSNGWSVALQIQGLVRQSHTVCPFVSLPAMGNLGCSTQGSPMVWVDNGAMGSKTVVGSGALLQVDHRFKFTEQWDDEPSLTVSVNLIAPTGPMIPVSMNFGLGDSQGVENDVELKAWRAVNGNGVSSELSHPYLHPGDAVTIEAELAFEHIENSPSPRSGSVDVCFYVDEVQNQCTAVYSNGIASFQWTVPSNQESVALRIELTPLQGQSISYAVPNSLDFNFDTVSPELLGMNIDPFDHIDASPTTSLTFQIADRPVLPSHAYLHLWRSWEDDTNMNGGMDLEEVSIHPLDLPLNRTDTFGSYGYAFDSSSYPSGAIMRGWLDVADTAGNPMLASGDFDTPLFNLQINNDGAPQLGSTPASWNLNGPAWLHPGESNLLSVPVWDLNGVTDLQSIEVDLASNHNTPVLVSWNATTQQCVTEEIFLSINACQLIAIGEDEVFATEGVFHINFTLEWGFNPDVSLVRLPSVMMHDRAGQSNVVALSGLEWRFSGELEIPHSLVQFNVDGHAMEGQGTWIQPRSEVGVTGSVYWYRSQVSVMQSIDLLVELGGIEASIDSMNGTFNGTIVSPLSPGTYALEIGLESPPNGAIDRSDDAAYAFFIVDKDEPTLVGVASPLVSNVLEETVWSSIQFSILIDEEDRLSEDDLMLNWAVHEAGLGITSPLIINGSLSLEVVGGRPYGAMIPTEAVLDIDTLLTASMRTQALELRVYVTGNDVAGHPISSVFNDIDSPLAVWALEQRVPIYTFEDPRMKPSKDIAEGDVLTLTVTIQNSGLANGTAQMFVERVESNGARTRIDAREIQIPAGGQLDYSKEWMPDQSGTMWIEYHIINGPSSQTSTVFVDEPRTEGILGSVAAVNPVLLILIFLLSVSLVAVLIFGLQSPSGKEYNASQQRQVVKGLPSLEQPKPPVVKSPDSGPYGAPRTAASPGENPYK